MKTTLTARRLLTHSGAVEYPVISLEDGVIASIEAGPPNSSDETLTPAFFDIHVHGAISYDFMAAGPREMELAGAFLASRGVAHFLATTITAPIESTLRTLERLASAIESNAAPNMATPVGIHLEGPFISCARRGVHPQSSLLPPDIPTFDRLQHAALGHIRLVTIAPELPGAGELIAHAIASGVRVSLGHSDANAQETLAGITAGASSATHCFNAMRPLGHREPGIAGTVLDQRDLFAELICDGVHVAPAMVRLWLKMKGPDRAILVTDGMSATGMPDGEYMLGELRVDVSNGVCLLDGTLAGSVLTLDRAVANLCQFTGVSLPEAVRLASINPARMLGLDHLTEIEIGRPANFCVFGADDHFRNAIISGQSTSA